MWLLACLGAADVVTSAGWTITRAVTAGSGAGLSRVGRRVARVAGHLADRCVSPPSGLSERIAAETTTDEQPRNARSVQALVASLRGGGASDAGRRNADGQPAAVPRR